MRACAACNMPQGLLRNCPTLDDPLPLFLATAYAVNHPAMHLNNNDSFVQGTVQGAQWYTLMGGMQVCTQPQHWAPDWHVAQQVPKLVFVGVGIRAVPLRCIYCNQQHCSRDSLFHFLIPGPKMLCSSINGRMHVMQTSLCADMPLSVCRTGCTGTATAWS